MALIHNAPFALSRLRALRDSIFGAQLSAGLGLLSKPHALAHARTDAMRIMHDCVCRRKVSGRTQISPLNLMVLHPCRELWLSPGSDSANNNKPAALPLPHYQTSIQNCAFIFCSWPGNATGGSRPFHFTEFEHWPAWLCVLMEFLSHCALAPLFARSLCQDLHYCSALCTRKSVGAGSGARFRVALGFITSWVL
jgi:hypothetical protein